MTDPFTPIDGTVESDQPDGDRRTIGQIVFGLVLVGFGLAWLIAATDVIDVPWRAVIAAALVLVGGALAASATRERHSGLVGVGVILTLMLTLVSTSEGLFDLPLSGGIGERDYRPTNIGLVADEYRLGIGEIVVDLSDVAFPPGETRVDASVTLGSLVVILPSEVAVRVDGRTTAGEVRIFGDVFSGTSIDEIVEDAGYEEAEVRLSIDAAAGFGEVEVRR